ncbi:hypothetical protein [Pseudomonas cremoricolorata]|uniref:hypothetical protein n=1 Tax=Pseudomonas cremoricolorata TaxID=157783 RepID=UPI00048F128E|nr:hypothetical protein [Pseudomonas cremoricolorata]
MNKDKLVWPNINSEMQRHVVFDDQSKLVPDLPSQEIVLRSLKALRRFFLDKGLLATNITDANNELLDMDLKTSDFTDEGLTLIKLKVPSWSDSKSSKKNPPDMTMLEKALKEIRLEN